jgi:hypothetical protein
LSRPEGIRDRDGILREPSDITGRYSERMLCRFSKRKTFLKLHKAIPETIDVWVS